MPATSRNEGTAIGEASRVWMLPDDAIGGAIVRRGFTRFTKSGAEYLKSGMRMTADQEETVASGEFFLRHRPPEGRERRQRSSA